MNTQSSAKLRYLPPLILALIAFVVRFAYSHFERTVWGDEPFYLWLGRNWFRGDGYTFAFSGHWDYHHTPGYPFITATLTFLTQDMRRASEWSYILFGTLLVVVVYALATRIYDWRSGFAAGLITALAPATALMPLYWGTMTEPPYLALAFTGILFAHRAYRRFNFLDILFAGIFLAFAYYVRPESIVFWGAMGLVLGLRGLAAPPRLRNLAYPAFLGFVFLLLLFPYLYQVRQATGKWTVSQKVGAHFATAKGLATGRFQQFDIETWGLDSAGRNVRFFSTETADASAASYILSDPIGYAKVVYGNARKLARQLVSPRLLPAFGLLFLGLALFTRAWNRDRGWDELFLAATLLTGISFIFFFVQERYLAPLIPPLFIWFGHGLIWMGQWLGRSARNLIKGENRPIGAWEDVWVRRAVWIPLILAGLYLLAITPAQIAQATNPGSTRPAHRLAAQALSEYVQPGEIVMARYVSIPFEAGAEWVPTPAADVDAVLRYARLKNARYWVVDALEARILRPQFLPLIEDPTHPPPGLEYLIQVDDGQGPVVIYRLKFGEE